MATWTTIPNSVLETGKPIRAVDGRALRDNPIAIAEGASGAPVVLQGWHPYDLANIGDGATGLVYDNSVDGNVASVTLPDFEASFDYRIVVAGLSSSIITKLRIEIYREADAAYSTLYESSDFTTTTLWRGILEMCAPRRSAYVHGGFFPDGFGNSGALIFSPGDGLGIFDATLQGILRARISVVQGNIDAGSIRMLRRLEVQS